MGAETMDLTALRDPFPPQDIEWRVGRAGKKNGQVWAKVLAYITSRAIMDRLDQVCGPDGWQTDFREGPGHLQAGIGIRIDGEWVWKWDGTGMLAASDGLSGTDAGKGDFSNALKRVAVQWSIGRYLYQLPEGWANVHPDGTHYGRLPQDKGCDTFYWDPPDLPEWAKPGGNGRPGPGERSAVDRSTGEVRNDKPAPSRNGGTAFQCPKCETSEVWDNRAKKASGKFKATSPDYTCKDKDGCGWTLWLDGAVEKIEAALDHLLHENVIDEAERDIALVKAQTGDLDKVASVNEYIREKRTHLDVPAGT